MVVRRDDFLVGPKERAAEAIQAGKTKEALDYLNDVGEQFHALDDAYSSKIGFLKGTLAKIQGDKWYEGFERKLIFESFRPKYERFKGMTVEQQVGAICNSIRAHFSEFHVEEDSEKFVGKDNGLRCRRQVSQGWHCETARRDHQECLSLEF